MINGYTKCKLKHNDDQIVYHANPSSMGSEWYDFCMVDFDDDMCPARIHGFFQYKSSGVPTNKLVGAGNSVKDIRESKEHDYSMYAVIHAAKKHLNYSKLEEHFVSSF